MMMLWNKKSNTQEYMMPARGVQELNKGGFYKAVLFFPSYGLGGMYMLSQSMVRDGLLDFMILSRSGSRGLVFFYIPYHTCTVTMTFSIYVF